MSGIDRKSLIILAEDAANKLSTVLVDSSRRLVSVFVGSEGATVKQNATGELVTEIQGSESLAVKQKTTTGELITEIQGSEALAIKQKATTGEMVAEMQGSEGIAIAQETATGEMIAIFKALHNSSLITVAADANGRISADFGLLEQATFDMDSFADRTDSRISYSSTITMDYLKYWINVQSGLIAIRYINVQGTASLGTYSLTVASNNIISGSTGVNMPTTDSKIYRKTIVPFIFNYSESNCLFKGCIIDYLKNPDDLSAGYTVVTGGASAPNVYDDDLTSSVAYANGLSPFVTVWEVSFTSSSVSEAHAYFHFIGWDADQDYYRLQLNVNSVWTTIKSGNTNSFNPLTVIHHQTLSYTLVTGARFQIQGANNDVHQPATLTIRDLSLF